MKIALDFGHCINNSADTGAQGCGFREEILTREVGTKVQAKLNNLGYETVVVSCDSASSVNESLSYRVNKANSSGADIFVSIHFNACPGGFGAEVYTYKGREVPQARSVLNEICALGYSNRGIRSKELYVINHTNMVSMLIECCFIDSQSDMNRFNAENMANAIVKGLTGQVSNISQPITPIKIETPVQAPQSQTNEVSQLQQLINAQGFGNISVDGIPGPQTLSHCPTVKQGANGQITQWIQLRVGASPDSDFGPATKRAVQWFQQSRGLSADGIVGQNTWRALLGM